MSNKQIFKLKGEVAHKTRFLSVSVSVNTIRYRLRLV